MKDQGRGPATYVVPWAPHLLNWALSLDMEGNEFSIIRHRQTSASVRTPVWLAQWLDGIILSRLIFSCVDIGMTWWGPEKA